MRASQPNPEHFLIETVGWMLDKVDKEHSRMSDTMHQQYCDCTASIYQIFELKIIELNEAYEGLKSKLRTLKDQVERQESTAEVASFLIVAAHVRDTSAPFLDVTKEANLRISFSSSESATDTNLESVYSYWGLASCSCDRCFELAALHAHKTQSEVVPQTPGCRHYPAEKTYKLYKCCKRQYFCWKCHDEWEKHVRLDLVREVCVRCGQEIKRGKCEWCERQSGSS